eukprot:CAMPEP_0118680554 /NCGR_PEP_ID=MMETSP0800-20121206/4431_1 /TAXON_ID=210618 ORGANISM="Striatella unipunctata, Strain CCMP2910" /NCGR_SAMPLE_ID=MMETSP0800 /ASSEMBLY_ACC=CAM_ASM_000638 /LENGTH=135 /DNA_ID=CAMNT_0006576719 /DNA_START=50 /DNA_END=457 /DNA_ORIENTATION=-
MSREGSKNGLTKLGEAIDELGVATVYSIVSLLYWDEDKDKDKDNQPERADLVGHPNAFLPTNNSMEQKLPPQDQGNGARKRKYHAHELVCWEEGTDYQTLIRKANDKKEKMLLILKCVAYVCKEVQEGKVLITSV